MKKSVSFSSQELATKINGTHFGSVIPEIKNFCPSNQPLEKAVTFMSGKYISIEDAKKFDLLILDKSGAEKLISKGFNKSHIVVDNTQLASLQLTEIFFETSNYNSFFHQNSNIDSSVKIGANTLIHPSAVIYPNVQIGSNTIIHAGVIIREDSIIGDSCIIQPNCVIGADGFGYIPDPKLGLKAVPQVGNVIIGNRVDIGANSCIDRATIGSTIIGDGTKIDNLVQIGHNVIIGKNCIICGQVGIAGSCTIGDQVVFAGKSGSVDHIKIASKVRIGACSTVLSDILEPGDYSGSPAIKASLFYRNLVHIKNLHNIISEFKKKLA